VFAEIALESNRASFTREWSKLHGRVATDAFVRVGFSVRSARNSGGCPMRSIRPCPLFMAVGCMPLWAIEARAAAPPVPAETFVHVLRQTAAVIEGDVQDVSFRYDEREGPRTVATVGNIVVHVGSLGQSPPRTLELRSFGGFLPDGREVIAMHVPSFTVGKRHVVFLRNTEWTLSPVAFGFVFRVERKGAATAIVDPFGRLVAGVGLSGPIPGPFLWQRPDGGFDESTRVRETIGITESVVDRALNAAEFANHVRAFAAATDAWPHGTFMMTPTLPHRAWQFVATTPAEFVGTNDGEPGEEEELLACFGPDEEAADTTPFGGEMCEAGGVP
jgi:hypothetical protein